MSVKAAQRAIERQLVMDMDVERNTQDDTDPYNNPEEPEWGGTTAFVTPGHPATYPLHIGLACRVWSAMKRQMTSDNRTILVEDLRALVALGTDIQEDDRITIVRNQDGTTFLSDVVKVEAVQPKVTHLELSLEAIS